MNESSNPTTRSTSTTSTTLHPCHSCGETTIHERTWLETGAGRYDVDVCSHCGNHVLRGWHGYAPYAENVR